MDNRLKFLYRHETELWGHRGIAGAGNGETGASIDLGGRQIPLHKKICDAERNKVAKPAKQLSRKAAIVFMLPVP